MGYENVKYIEENGIGILTVDRPKVLNALNGQTIREIRSVLGEVKGNEAVRVLVITGSGEKAFVAGADIGEIKDLGLKDGFDSMRTGHQMNYDIETLGIPTIAAVNGLALGGGCELAMSCSLRIVSENAKLGLPELGLGVIPGYGGTQRLARLIGKGRALWYLLTGDMIDAATSVELGLANMMVKPEELMEKTLKIAGKIASKAPLAVKMALTAVKYGLETDLETGLILEIALANLAIASEDKNEGISAFFEKRKPEFKGK
ncbi:MAG: enoyl-CoA hydratase/isomerase family protein [Syntrophobacterales bacterium]|nr:enoyl-CoA hydratase/isomerase family protein [Syntrophobacterales bacterium]